MNYEERYNQALKVIESLYNVVKYQSSTDALFASQTIEKAFPELKENEDEKIRKELISAFTVTADKREHEIYGHGITYGQVLDWLEKQGEQPSWSDYDERIKRCIQVALTDVYEKRFNDYDTTLKDCLAWLKSLKDRVQPQPKQEWSEEDEKIINTIISDITRIRTSCGIGTEEYNIRLTALNWLKSLKDRIQLQLHWKPSEEQMEALLYALGKGGTYNKEALTQLYNNLKT